MADFPTRAMTPSASVRRRGRQAAVPAAALAMLLLGGCVTRHPPAPVEDRTAAPAERTATPAIASAPAIVPGSQGIPLDGHLVVSGDTLYGIAWRYGVDYREIARINGIEPPYRIFVGQRLQLQAPVTMAPGTSVAGVPAGYPSAPAAAPLPAEPVSRGFEFVPESPAQTETWQDVPPPAAQTPIMPPASPPTVAGPAPMGTAPANVPLATGPASTLPPGAIPPSSAPLASAPVATAPVTTAPQATAPIAAVPQAVTVPAETAPTPTAPAATAVVSPASPIVMAPPVAAEPATRPVQPASSGGSVGTWRWPTKATVQKGFGSGSKGVDFKLDPAQPVLAAGGGEVVYAGNGLGGFRHLVIVKHDQRFLSAYSLNRGITVQEGQRLESGAIIAAADPAGAASTLRFEIRKDGQPVDPASVIGR
ncbi:MAG: peptidoglycan DD-metalloendopeptidase family protein [Pseudomonadales bacterium]